MIRKLAFGFIGFGLLAATPAMASDVAGTNTQAAGAGSTQSAQATVGLIGGAIGGAVSPSAGPTPGGAGPAGATSFLKTRDSGLSGGAGDKRFGAWLQGVYTSIDNSQAGLQFDGNVYNLVGGLDYMVNDKVVVGLALGYEALDLTTVYSRGTIESEGFTVAPYVGFALNKTWSIDATAGYTWLSYDTTRNLNATRGTFDAERWFAAANLNANYAFGRVRVLPKIGVLYLEEEADAYRETGTNATSVASTTTKLGRLYAGGRVGYAFDSVMPYAKVIGEYDFEKNAAVSIGNGRFSNDDEVGAQLGLGLDFYGSNTVSGNVEAAYLSAGRSDLEVWSATARLRVKF